MLVGAIPSRRHSSFQPHDSVSAITILQMPRGALRDGTPPSRSRSYWNGWERTRIWFGQLPRLRALRWGPWLKPPRSDSKCWLCNVCGVSVLKETVKLIFINFKFFNLEVTGKVEQKANNHRVCISRKVSSHCPRLWKHLDWVNGRDVLISQSRNHCFTWNCCFFLQFLLGAQSSPSPVTSVKKPEDWWLPRQICVTSLARPECNRAPDCPMCWAFKACCLPRVFSLSFISE